VHTHRVQPGETREDEILTHRSGLQLLELKCTPGPCQSRAASEASALLVLISSSTVLTPRSQLVGIKALLTPHRSLPRATLSCAVVPTRDIAPERTWDEIQMDITATVPTRVPNRQFS
jgi:hypothetical protein